jgi:protein-arginine kinase activator protein McsA/G:T-mismatch repair DNA endonuclease (very short patch repair protein)
MSVKLDQQTFIERCQLIHNYRYSYEKTSYTNMRSKIEIICPVHGNFWQKALSHIQGYGCEKCRIDNDRLSFQEFLKRARNIHGNLYEYDSYGIKIVIVICKIHGKFAQNKWNHINGSGCKLCFIEAEKLTLQQFIDISNKIHNNKYNYSNSVYINNISNIEIICSIHSSFWQLPSHHMRGAGCPKCAHTISQPEIKWLDSLNIPAKFRHKSIKINGKFFKPDAINLEEKIIYEFYGDFWHGNPNRYDHAIINHMTKTTFGELYQKTIDKENYYINNGFKVISIWESEFKNESK